MPIVYACAASHAPGLTAWREAAAPEQLAKDLPRIPLVTEEVLYAHAKRLSGVYVMPDGNINSDEISLK